MKGPRYCMKCGKDQAMHSFFCQIQDISSNIINLNNLNFVYGYFFFGIKRGHSPMFMVILIHLTNKILSFNHDRNYTQLHYSIMSRQF
jgi:hypothetical protein